MLIKFLDSIILVIYINYLDHLIIIFINFDFIMLINVNNHMI